MSTSTPPRPRVEEPTTRPAPARSPLRGSYWAVLRLHRGTLWAGAGLVLVFAAVVLSLHFWSQSFSPAEFKECARPSAGCEGTEDPYYVQSILARALDLAAVPMLLLPAAVGVLVAGPMTGRELESGLYRLAWTQSVSPARWLATRLTVGLATALVLATAVVLVFRTAWIPLDATWNRGFGWWPLGTFEALGPSLVAQCLLAAAVGALAGLLLRRLLPAIVVTAGITGAVVLLMDKVRWSLLPLETVTGKDTVGATIARKLPDDAFPVTYGMINGSGERLPADTCFKVTHRMDDCPAELDITGTYVDFHPKAHFAQIHWLESGILVALAAVVTVVAFRVLRRRTP